MKKQKTHSLLLFGGLILILLFVGSLKLKGVKENYCLVKTNLKYSLNEPMEGEKWDHYTSCYDNISLTQAIGLLNNKVTNRLSKIQELDEQLKDPKNAGKDTQVRNDLHDQWCSLIARSAEDREKAVANIRSFTGKPTLDVEYECAYYNDADYEGLPTKETYTAGGDRYYIDPQTNYIYSVDPISGRWGYKEDGTRWFDPIREYDYDKGMTQEEVEQYARDFIAQHEDSIGKIDLNSLILEAGNKGAGTSQANYYFAWKGETQTISVPDGIKTCGDVREDLVNSYDDNGTPCITSYEKQFTPSISISFSSGGGLISFGNQFNPDLW
jgi:hypothetical protein